MRLDVDSRRAPAGDSAGPSSSAVDIDAFPGDWRRVRAFAERPAAPAAPAPARERPTPAATASAVHGRRVSKALALHAGLCVQCEADDGSATAFRCCMGTCEYEFASFAALRRHQNGDAHCADQSIIDEASAAWTASRVSAQLVVMCACFPRSVPRAAAPGGPPEGTPTPCDFSLSALIPKGLLHQARFIYTTMNTSGVEGPV